MVEYYCNHATMGDFYGLILLLAYFAGEMILYGICYFQWEGYWIVLIEYIDSDLRHYKFQGHFYRISM